MAHRRRVRRDKPDPDIPLTVRLGIDAPVAEIDFTIQKTEELLAQLKRLRFMLNRRREKDRKRFIDEQGDDKR